MLNGVFSVPTFLDTVQHSPTVLKIVTICFLDI